MPPLSWLSVRIHSYLPTYLMSFECLFILLLFPLHSPAHPITYLTGPGPFCFPTRVCTSYCYDKSQKQGRWPAKLLIVCCTDRYFGGSSPYDGFDARTLQWLTLEQSAADLVNFAQNVKFPFDKEQTSVASKVVSSHRPMG